MGEKERQGYIERRSKEIDDHNNEGCRLQNRWMHGNNIVIQMRKIEEDVKKRKGVCMPSTEYIHSEKDKKAQNERRLVLSQDSAYKILNEKIDLFLYPSSGRTSPDYTRDERKYIQESLDREMFKKGYSNGSCILRALQVGIEHRTLREEEYQQILFGGHPCLKSLQKLEEKVKSKRASEKKPSSLREWFKLFPF